MEFIPALPRPATRTFDSLALASSSAAAIASSKSSAEQRFWNSNLASIAQHKLFGKIQHLAFSADSTKIAATAATRIGIYETEGGQVLRQIQRTGGQIYGAEFRGDGSVIGCGGEDGSVRVFDVNSRTILREIKKAHAEAVHAVTFCSSLHLIGSAGDDQIGKIWDIRTKESVAEFKGHSDKIRAFRGIGNEFEFLSGSYDHSVRVWDVRNPRDCVVKMDHQHPVESVQKLNNGFASAGGPCVKVWDAHGLLKSETIAHKKHVTSLTVGGNGSRLISGSLDQFVKVYDLEESEKTLHAESPSLRIVASLEFSSSVMSLAMSNDGFNLAIGTLEGIVDLRRIRENPKKKQSDEKQAAPLKKSKIVERGDDVEQEVDLDAEDWKFDDDEEDAIEKEEDDELIQEEQKYMGSKLDSYLSEQLKTMRSSLNSKLILKAGAYQYFMRGEDENAEGDIVVSAKSKKSISRWDALLKQFKRKEAFDAVLETHHSGLIIAVIEKLLRSNSLKLAIQNRSDIWVSDLIEFCRNNLSNARFNGSCIKCLEMLLDLYEDKIYNGEANFELEAALKQTKEVVKKELAIHSDLFKLKGTLELILSSASVLHVE
jgi:U3 small nucleolar RNA-associated protein 15